LYPHAFKAASTLNRVSLVSSVVPSTLLKAGPSARLGTGPGVGCAAADKTSAAPSGKIRNDREQTPRPLLLRKGNASLQARAGTD